MKPHHAHATLPAASCLRSARCLRCFLLALMCLALGSAHGQDKPPKGRGGGPQALVLPPDVQALAQLSAVLGRPTRDSITLNLLSARTLELVVAYGVEGEPRWQEAPPLRLSAGEPREILLSGLKPDTAHRYQLRWREPGQASFEAGSVQYFHTARAQGRTFSFELQGDSHPERRHQFDPALYAQTLRAAAADRPDFYLTLGDDFSVDTLKTLNAASVEGRYLLQRPFLALVGQTAPLFLVNGNHEQAAAANLDGTANNVAVWAQTARNRYFPQPAPDDFYSGDTEPVPHIGLLRDYYAWTWGDALFVVIDPYWHSPQPVDNALGSRDKAGRDLWNNTLGDAQYRWLRQTLESSMARFKFVFAHHVLGTGRGGAKMARLYEWGGEDPRGRSQFAQRRPGWPEPVHALMVRTGVSIFFQGHDHVFAREIVDGVVYQTVPEPADPQHTLYFPEAYEGALLQPNSGRLRVRVSTDRASVTYIRSWLQPPDSVPDEVAYDVLPRH